jgi:hypothetical protein
MWRLHSFGGTRRRRWRSAGGCGSRRLVHAEMRRQRMRRERWMRRRLPMRYRSSLCRRHMRRLLGHSQRRVSDERARRWFLPGDVLRGQLFVQVLWRFFALLRSHRARRMRQGYGLLRLCSWCAMRSHRCGEQRLGRAPRDVRVMPLSAGCANGLDGLGAGRERGGAPAAIVVESGRVGTTARGAGAERMRRLGSRAGGGCGPTTQQLDLQGEPGARATPHTNTLSALLGGDSILVRLAARRPAARVTPPGSPTFWPRPS